MAKNETIQGIIDDLNEIPRKVETKVFIKQITKEVEQEMQSNIRRRTSYGKG